MNRSVLIAILLLVGISQGRAHDPSWHNFRMVAFGRPVPAPDIVLPDLQMRTRQLAEFAGHYVLLNFWATWCVPCRQEMPALQTLHDRLREKNFVVLGIAADEGGLQPVASFVKRLKLTFPILIDAQLRVSRKYGATDLPSTFLLNPQGQVIAAAKGERDWASPQALSYFKELVQGN